VKENLEKATRKYGLSLIRVRHQDTSETIVSLQFLILNLDYSGLKIGFRI